MAPTGQQHFGNTLLPRNICDECGGSGEECYDIPMPQSFSRDIGELKEGWRDCEWCDASGFIEVDEDDDD